MKGIAKEWFISLSTSLRPHTLSLAGWSYLLHNGLGEDLRQSEQRAEAHVHIPWRESVEEYFYDKAAMHKRAESDIIEIELIREVWKGLSTHASELIVVFCKQLNQKEFRDKLL